MRLLFGALTSLVLSVSVLADTAIKNVTAITMEDDNVIENAIVVIQGDRIAHIGTSLPSRFSITQEIDGTGKYLTPGLAEMHGHLPYASASAKEQEEILFLYIAGGVTTVRGMLGDPVQFEMRKAIENGEMVGPTLYLAAPSLNGNSVRSVEDAIAKVRQYKTDGWDLLKIHPGLTNDEYHAIAETARELYLPFGGHVPAEVGIAEALAAKQTSIDHLDGFLELVDGYSHEITPSELKQIVDVYKIYRPSWLVPTQALFGILIGGGDADALAARFENQYMSPATRANWKRRIASANKNATPYAHRNRQKVLRALSMAGARIVMGSDAPQLYSVPGFSIWREIETMTEAGLSAKEILKIGTANAGVYFSDKDDFGQIKTGARADLLLLDADPRIKAENLFKQAGVMAAGRWYSKADIDTRLSQIAESNK